MDYVSPNDVKNAQIAMEYFVGDGYWRTRVPIKLFYEVKSVWVEALDWQTLCLQLELYFDRNELIFRRCIGEPIEPVAGVSWSGGKGTRCGWECLVDAIQYV